MSERMCRFDPGSGYKGDGFCHPFFVPGAGVEPDLCLGALPLLYPAASPFVFAYFIGKYTALAVALRRDTWWDFWGDIFFGGGIMVWDIFFTRYKLG